MYGPLGGVGGSSVIANGPHGGGARSSIRTCKSFTVFYVSMRPPCTDAEQRDRSTRHLTALQAAGRAASGTEQHGDGFAMASLDGPRCISLQPYNPFTLSRHATSPTLRHPACPVALCLSRRVLFFSGAVVLSCSPLSASMPVLSV